ncbi:MAG: transcription antitermination factor NusB [Tuberibacillus sp.]
MNRRQAREKAIQALFQIEVGGTSPDEAIENVTEGKSDPFLNELVHQTYRHLDEVDKIITKYLIKWPFDRIGNIDKAIMRLAVSEFLYFNEIPVKVTLNEAIEMAKTFGDDDSRRFTNGVLSKIVNEEGITKQGE